MKLVCASFSIATIWNGLSFLSKPLPQISVLLHPLAVGNAPLLWQDWSKRAHRRACQQLVRGQHLEVSVHATAQLSQCHGAPAPVLLSRAQRARFRLSWAQRLLRNARAPGQEPVTIKLFGVPEHFAAFLGLRTA
jgi:hypothetical protein